MPKKKLNWDYVKVCSKCGKKEKIADYRRMLRSTIKVVGNSPPDPTVQFLCIDCQIKQDDWIRKKYGGPPTNYIIAHKLAEMGLPPTMNNIKWYKKALMTSRGGE